MAKRTIAECKPSKRADGRWIAQPVIKLADGRKKRLTIINRDKNVVIEKLLEVQNQQRKMIPFSRSNWTVGDYLDYWLNEVALYKLRSTTWESYESAVRIYIKPTIGKKKLNELNEEDVSDALDELEKDKVTIRTRKKYKQVLSSCLSYAVYKKTLFRNVAMSAKMPVYTPVRSVPWTADQAAYFIESVSDDQYFVAYLIMITYGLRIGEMMGLRYSDIDFNNDTFVVRQQVIRTKKKLTVQTVKTDAGRRQLPLVPAVRKALLDHACKNNVTIPRFAPNRELTGEGLVITTSIGTALEPNGFRQRHFYPLIEKYGLPPLTPHGMRHTAATLLKDMGVPVIDAQEILGHADVLTTMRIYQHGNEKIKRNALASMGAGLTAGIRSSCSQIVQSNDNNLQEKNNPYPLNQGGAVFRLQAYETPSKRSQSFGTSVKSDSEQVQD